MDPAWVRRDDCIQDQKCTDSLFSFRVLVYVTFTLAFLGFLEQSSPSTPGIVKAWARRRSTHGLARVTKECAHSRISPCL